MEIDGIEKGKPKTETKDEDCAEHDSTIELAKSLIGKPVRVDTSTPYQKLVPFMEERLDVLLRYHGCSASADGWRKLALQLALRLSMNSRPFMDIRIPSKDNFPKLYGPPEGGRPRKDLEHAFFLHFMNRERETTPRPSVRTAAIRVSKKFATAPSAKSLQHLYKKFYKIDVRGEVPYKKAKDADGNEMYINIIPRLRYDVIINQALYEAAERLEKRPK